MGCCLSREEDRFDANEALLPKSSGTTKQSAVAAKSDASGPSSTKSVDTGSYKSPEPTLSHHTHGAAAHSRATVVTTTIATEKHTAVVESIDLLGLDKTTSPTPPSTLSATAAAFQPHSTALAVPTAKPTPPETTTQAKPELSPPKPTSDAMSPGSPQSVEGAARPVEVTVAHVTTPEPLLTKQERSPPLPLEKKSGTIEPKAPTSSVASTDDADNDNDNDNDADKASASAASGVGSGSKKGKKKKKKGRK